MGRGIVVIVLFLAASAAHAVQHWGEPPSRSCRGEGVLQLSSVLWDIPWGKNWAEACHETGASWAGGRPPDRCPQVVFQYGEWDTFGCDRYLEYRVCNGLTCTQRVCRFATGSVYHNTYPIDEVIGFMREHGFTVTRIPDRRSNDGVEMVVDLPHHWRILLAERV